MSTITKNGLGRLLAVRLSPGEDLLEGIFSSCRQHGFRRAAVLSGIGSLKEVRIYNEGILSTDGENIIYGYGDQPRFWGGPQGVMELCSVKGTICTEEDGQPGKRQRPAHHLQQCRRGRAGRLSCERDDREFDCGDSHRRAALIL